MISCPSCLRIFTSVPVYPLVCKCGSRLNATAVVGGPISIANHWRTLHSFAYRETSTPNQKREFVANWEWDIPNRTAGCACRENWAAMDFKFDYSSDEAFQDSTVDGHNLVRSKLGQRLLTHAQSRRLWNGPRVAFLSSSYLTVGGTEIFHRMLLPRLRDYVNVVGFATTAFSGGDGSLLKVPYVIGTDDATKLAEQADVIVTWGIDSVVELLPRKKQRVVSVHHSDASSLWSNRLQLIPCVDEVVCVNPDTAKFLRKKTSKPIHFIANCVDPDRVRPAHTRDAIRAQWNIPSSAKVVMFGHRLSEEKQPRKAVEIANALPEGWIMALVGDGELASEFKSSDRVRVVGPVSSLADWFAASDVFISLSTYDGYGLSVAEALAFGIPTVSTPRGIAVDRAIPCEAGASVAEWCAAIVAAYGTQPARHEDLCDIDRFIDQWVNVCHGSSN